MKVGLLRIARVLGKLDELKKEVKIRIKINADEIFQIGEILTIGKKLCQKTESKF